METYEILGRKYPVTGYVTAPQIGSVPLVDMPMMSDERWNELCRESAVKHYIDAFGHGPDSVEEALRLEHEAIRRLVAAE